MNLTGTIIFSSGRSADIDIWSLNLESRNLKQLTSGSEWNDFPRWSPDGNSIAYVSNDADLIPSLWIMNADGSDKRRLTRDIYCHAPSWHPDGKALIFCSNHGNPDVFNITTLSIEAGSEPETLFHRDGIEMNPSWSPDGQAVLFSSVCETESDSIVGVNTEIFEYNSHSGAITCLSRHPMKDYAPAYSPDGKRIAFVSHRDESMEADYLRELQLLRSAGESGDMQLFNTQVDKVRDMKQEADIWIMDRDGSNLKQVTTNQGPDVGCRWSPCGKFLCYSSASSRRLGQERLSIVNVETGQTVPIEYERDALVREIGTHEEKYLNRTFLQLLVPDFIERKMVDASIWGQEKHPDWR